MPERVNQLPKKLDGVDIIEIVIVNDGSEDNTIKEVQKYNDLKTHIINLPIRKGLSNAFTTGINFCLKQSADIIVNTDADNQYDASNIQDLINPIIILLKIVFVFRNNVCCEKSPFA